MLESSLNSLLVSEHLFSIMFVQFFQCLISAGGCLGAFEDFITSHHNTSKKLVHKGRGAKTSFNLLHSQMKVKAFCTVWTRAMTY